MPPTKIEPRFLSGPQYLYTAPGCRTRLVRLALARRRETLAVPRLRPEGLLGNTAAAHATSPRARCCVVELPSLCPELQTVGADPLPVVALRLRVPQGGLDGSSPRATDIEEGRAANSSIRNRDVHFVDAIHLWTFNCHRRDCRTTRVVASGVTFVILVSQHKNTN